MTVGSALKTVQQYIGETPLWPDGTPVSQAPLLVVFLFGMGLALGADYPTAHMMIPKRSRRGHGIRGVLREDRRRHDGLSVSGPAVGPRAVCGARYLDRDIRDWRGLDLALSYRNPRD